MAKSRDDFLEKTKIQIAKRAGWLCSFPTCRNPTVGATSDGNGEINIGTAAHICAAAAGGPRYDEKMTAEERSSAANGIWMCRDHGKAIDSTDPEFTVERLREWKQHAEKESWQRVLRKEMPPAPSVAAGDTQLIERLRAAAGADLKVFRRTAKWPPSSIALSLKVDGFDAPVTADALAGAVSTLDDLILVAPPGMGKTTALFQIANGVLANGNGTPIVVPLGDWATENATILASVLSRPAFNRVSEDDFRKVAAQSSVVLLLDGWNELDADARKRARVQVERLRAELPELGLVISTRRQALDVPFGGTQVDLLPLDDEQQMQIAIALRGEAGARIADQAWRTAGVRELVTIPLYLTTLLALPEGAPFPTTKEEMLRHFVTAHEKDASHAEALRSVAQGFQQDYLDGLAVFATRTANTSITDSNARRAVSETEAILVQNGQITIKSQPNAVLDVLVSSHVLMRAGDTPGVSFQHQQFQEWYASHSVERLMLDAAENPANCDKLKSDVLNQRSWEEAILFTVERLARGNQDQQKACGAAIQAAMDVDPMLAAEMIFRSTDSVWGPISSKIQDIVRAWHKPGKVDRALRFMVMSGRAEFVDLVWPLITHENSQVHLPALRAGRRFRPTVLGSDAPKRISALTPEIRKSVLHQIASNGGMDGLDLATTIAKADSDPEIKATVIEALAFRRADRHVVEILSTADDKTFELVAVKSLVDDNSNAGVQKGLKAARERLKKAGISDAELMRSLAYAKDDEGHDKKVAELVARMEIDPKNDSDRHIIYEINKRYPHALAKGLLMRVHNGSALFYGSDDILAAAGFALEDENLVDIALSESGRRDDRADAAASVLGPKAVGRMIDAYLEAKKRVRDGNGNFNQAASDRYHDLRSRIGHTPGASLIAAVQARAKAADNEEIVDLAGLLSRQSDGGDGRGRPFSTEGLVTISALAHQWGERMLASGDEAKRWQIASIPTLISRAPSVTSLPLLKKLLDDNLRRFRAFREEAIGNGWRQGEAVNEARTPHTNEYHWAFLAIKAPETAALMESYLADEHFGQLAALVLAKQWSDANEPKSDERFRGGVDFSRVAERRAARAANPTVSSTEADAIFRVIDSLIVDGSTGDQKKHAVALGIVASRMPHGERADTIKKLLELAPRKSRAGLLLSLTLSGESIDIKLVEAGIAETFEAAKKDTWILTQSDGYELREWLQLMPFVDRPIDALSVVRSMPDAQRNPRFLEEMVGLLGGISSDEAGDVLFKLAEEDPRFYQNRIWQTAVLRVGTPSAGLRLIELAANGTLQSSSRDDFHLSQELSGLIGEFPQVRSRAYDLLKDGMASQNLDFLARSVAENPDAEGLLLLVDLETKHKRSYMSWQTIERVVTEHVPSEWKGAYNVVPVPGADLRKRLLALSSPGASAAHYLNIIDKIRDDYGAPDSEPRHPDLESGKSWPIVKSDSTANV